MVPLPEPGMPPVRVTQETGEEAVHGHPVAVVTAIDAAPPVGPSEALLGDST